MTTSAANLRDPVLYTMLRCLFMVLVLNLGSLSPALGATLLNGGVVSDSISVAGEQDVHTFTANAGDSVHIRVADTANGFLAPFVSLFAPDGTLLVSDAGGVVASIVRQLAVTGTYTVVVRDGTQSGAQTGPYNVYFAAIPGANEGGELLNGGVIADAIDVGDVDSYTFTATAGESVQISVADTSNGFLAPFVWLYGPNGSLVSSDAGSAVASIVQPIAVSGTYTVVVADGTQGGAGTGSYNIYFGKAPGVNEGGELINGGVISNSIDIGDLDSYTFNATAGESIHIRMADTSGGGLAPFIWLYAPNGTLLASDAGSSVAGIERQITESGTYAVVVADGTQGGAQTGNYNIYFVKAPGANEGGALVNGGVISNAIDLGDLDSYTFTAVTGDSVQIRVGDTSNGALAPFIWLYGPDGGLLASDAGSAVASIERAIAVSGTYTVVVADGTQGQAQTGNYNIYFVHMPGANEGGVLNSGDVVSNAIDIGDLDSYTFVAAPGQTVQIDVTDTSNGPLAPLVWLYDPTGALVISDAGATLASIVRPLSVGGTYTIVVADGTQGEAQTGTYNLRLLLSNGTVPTPTNTPVPTATATPVPTVTNTPTPAPTATPLPTATNTPVPTAIGTVLPTATNTPVPTVTATSLPTATSTPVPTVTATPLPTATSTPVPTVTATPLPTATSTPVPTVTATPLPTATSTPVPTVTATSLPTATSTPVPTATATSLPTATSTPVPTATATPLPTATSTPVPTMKPEPTKKPECIDKGRSDRHYYGNYDSRCEDNDHADHKKRHGRKRHRPYFQSRW